MKNAYRAVLGALLLSAAACNGATDFRPDIIGTASFTFTGELAGSFVAAGEMKLVGGVPVEEGSWAGAVVRDGRFGVTAFHERGGGKADYLMITLPEAATGTYLIPEACVTSSDPSCPSVIFLLSSDIDGPELEAFCGIRTGQVTLTENDDGRARGTFSGTLLCGLSDEGADRVEVELSGGTFDVPVLGTGEG